MKKVTTRIFTNLAVLFLGMELILQLLNSDRYFQISGMYWPLVLCIVCTGVQFFIDGTTITNRNIPVIMLFSCVIVSVLRNLSAVQTGYLFSYLLLLSLMFLFFSVRFTPKQCNLLYWLYAVSGALIGFVMLCAGVRYYENDPSRITIQIVGVLIDPNYLGAYLLGPCLLWMQFALQSRKLYQWVLFGIGFAINLVGVMLTGSRGAFVALALGVVVYVWKFIKISRLKLSRKALWSIGAGIVVLAVVAFLVVPQEALVRLTNIFNWQDASNSRRISLWGQAIQTILTSPFIGQGICDTAALIQTVTGKADPSHCLYLELWLHLGVFGLVALACIVFPLLTNNRSPIAAGMCMVSLVSGIFISSEATLFFWMNVLVAELMCKNGTVLPLQRIYKDRIKKKMRSD